MSGEDTSAQPLLPGDDETTTGMCQEMPMCRRALNFYLVPNFAEFVGTFFLTFAASMSISAFAGKGAAAAALAIALTIGFTLMVFVYIFGGISGGHFNPAVSLGLVFAGHFGESEGEEEEGEIKNRDFAWVNIILYPIFQTLGAFFGALVAGLTTTNAPFPAPGVNKNGRVFDWSAFTMETLWTFALVLTVLNVACLPNTKTEAESPATTPNSFFGAAIGMIVAAGIIPLGSYSGAAFNPAVATGLSLTAAMFGKPGIWMHLSIYWCGPILGGIAAGLLHRLLNIKQYTGNLDPAVYPASANKTSFFKCGKLCSPRADI